MTASQLASEAGAILLGILALHVFFRGVETSWPNTYFSVSDAGTQRLAASPWRYLAFRVLPVFFVAFFAAGSLRRLGMPSGLAPAAIAGLHAVLTNGRAAVQVARRGSRSFAFWPIITGHVGAAVLAITLGLLAGLAARIDSLLSFIPSPSELSGTLWTGVAAAVLGAYIYRVASRPAVSVPDLIRKSRNSISPQLWEAAGRQAVRSGSDPSLVRAIMLTENLQRPPWIRRIEAVKARLGFAGTYGIMQVHVPRLITDEESLRLACEGVLRAVQPRMQNNQPDHDSIVELVRRHNPDPAFVGMVWQFYSWIRLTPTQ